MENARIKAALLISLVICSCQQPVDLDKERSLILESNNRHREAHFSGDYELMMQDMADTVFIVQRGDTRIETMDMMLKRWEAYFAVVKYSRWDDLQPPKIDISKDASMATMSVKKITVSTRETSEGLIPDTTYFAWTCMFKKIQGEWKIYSMASTRVPK